MEVLWFGSNVSFFFSSLHHLSSPRLSHLALSMEQSELSFVFGCHI
jgi:hypothetical protein